MDYDKLIARFKQFGGFKLVIEYAKLSVLGTVAKGFFRCLVKRQSFKAIYPEVLRKIEPYLVRRYSPIVQGFKGSRDSRLGHKRSKIIWFCWLQGLEKAPDIVKACYNSLERHMVKEFKVQGVPCYEIKVIDNENWKEYVELPEYIVKKWERARIPAALFSDLLRLELLIKYGGTWIDSTVLCTGFKDSIVQEFKGFLDADLFLFQYTCKGSIPVSISNWFITASANNEILIVLRDMLYAYWKDYDCTLDYYIFHLFFSMLSKEYPEEILAMPYGQSMNSLALLHHWGDKFDQKKWDMLTSQVSFHKLAFRESKMVTKNKGNYYSWIINSYL